MSAYDRAAEAVAEAEARDTARDNPDALTGEQIVDLALGHTPTTTTKES